MRVKNNDARQLKCQKPLIEADGMVFDSIYPALYTREEKLYMRSALKRRDDVLMRESDETVLE